ncbi:MAG TPA: Lrp/AsnC ligand binding domain-containing protein [Nitrososphaera sp.]
MTEAFVFVNCLLTMTGMVENAAKIIEGVLETHPTTGIYDIVLKVKAVDETSLRDVLDRVKGIQGVASTLTSIIYR